MQSLSKAIIKLFGIHYLLVFLVLLLEMSFSQFLFAGAVSELDLGLTAKGASPLSAAEALRARMAEELDLGIGPDLTAKSPGGHGGGGGGRGGGGRGRGGSASAAAHARTQADLRRHEAAERADQADIDREMAEAEAMIADAEREWTRGLVRSRRSRSKPAIGNQTQNVVPGLHDPAEGPHSGTTSGGTRSRKTPRVGKRIDNWPTSASRSPVTERTMIDVQDRALGQAIREFGKDMYHTGVAIERAQWDRDHGIHERDSGPRDVQPTDGLGSLASDITAGMANEIRIAELETQAARIREVLRRCIEALKQNVARREAIDRMIKRDY